MIIVGAGPAGISCGLAAEAAGINYIILEKGYLVNSLYHFPTNMTFFLTSKKLEIGEVPFISHNEKPTRTEALEYYRRIAESYKLNIQFNSEVLNVDKKNDKFLLTVTEDEIYHSHSLVLATGYYDTPRLLKVKGENLSKVKHYYDDAHPYIGTKLLVVGAANSACDVALETWQKGADVTMVIRGAELYKKVKYWILPNIQNRIKEGSIKAYFNSSVIGIEKNTVNIKTENEIVMVENDYVLAMTGYKPNYDFLINAGVAIDDSVSKKPHSNSDTLESNIENLYLAGVILSGLNTSELFIENTRNHGQQIIDSILNKK